MEAKKAAAILAAYKKRNLDYNYLTAPDSENKPHVHGVELRIGPLPISSPGGFEHALASRIAKKHGVTFKEYNFNEGTDGPPLCRPIFSAICYEEDEVHTKMEQIMQAEAELKARLENLAEFAMRSE